MTSSTTQRPAPMPDLVQIKHEDEWYFLQALEFWFQHGYMLEAGNLISFEPGNYRLLLTAPDL